MLDADARAVAVFDAEVLKDQPVDPRALAAQHERRLVLAYPAVEDHGARLNRDIGDDPRVLNCAVRICAWRDADGSRAIADRSDRIGELRIATPRLFDGEGCLDALRGGRSGKSDERGQREGATGHVFILPPARPHGRAA